MLVSSSSISTLPLNLDSPLATHVAFLTEYGSFFLARHQAAFIAERFGVAISTLQDVRLHTHQTPLGFVAPQPCFLPHLRTDIRRSHHRSRSTRCGSTSRRHVRRACLADKLWAAAAKLRER